jgi:hypothetical protein
MQLVQSSGGSNKASLTLLCAGGALCREFVEMLLPKFQKQNPQLEATTHLVRGHHPHLRGHFGMLSQNPQRERERDGKHSKNVYAVCI